MRRRGRDVIRERLHLHLAVRAVDRHLVGGIPAYPRSPVLLQSNRMPADDGWIPETLPPSESETSRSAIMATVHRQRRTREIEYPSGDGKPMAETEIHLEDMIDTIQVLEDYFAGQPNVYVCGNLLLFYEEGNRRKHVAPDVLVALDVPKEPPRENYLVWEEGKAPDFVVEITSKSTKQEDKKKKFEIYRDILRVSEYFLFDPTEDYLDPPAPGFPAGRRGIMFASSRSRAGCPAEVLGLHLERDGQRLRLFDPATGQRLPTRLEVRDAERRRADVERQRAEAADQRAEAADQRADEERQRADEERQRADEERQRAEAAEAARAA